MPCDTAEDVWLQDQPTMPMPSSSAPAATPAFLRSLDPIISNSSPPYAWFGVDAFRGFASALRHVSASWYAAPRAGEAAIPRAKTGRPWQAARYFAAAAV